MPAAQPGTGPGAGLAPPLPFPSLQENQAEVAFENIPGPTLPYFSRGGALFFLALDCEKSIAFRAGMSDIPINTLGSCTLFGRWDSSELVQSVA